MVNPKLVEYIRNEQARGHTQEQVYNYLVQYGYPSQEVVAAINYMNQQGQAPARQPTGMNQLGTPSPTVQLTSNQPGMNPPDQQKTQQGGSPLILIGAVACIAISLILGAWWLFSGPECGDGVAEEGETSETCCLDAGCSGEQTCDNNTCVDPVCGNCQYLESHVCKDYPCCDDTDCLDTETCINHACQQITCGNCQYIEARACIDSECCQDTDCDDSNPNTADKCLNPGTKSAFCSNSLTDLCSSNSQCDDNETSTKDECYGVPKKCHNIQITTCTGGDLYCPSSCNQTTDSDCPKSCNEDADCNDLNSTTRDFCVGDPGRCLNQPIVNCKEDSDCDDDDPSTKDMCGGSPLTCHFQTITTCKDDDDYCPPHCYYLNDLDCEEGEVHCLDLDCLIELSGLCAEANGTVSYMVETSGMLEHITYDVRIDSSGSRCGLRSLIKSKTVDFTDDLVQSMLDDGKTQTEIDDLEEETNKNATIEKSSGFGCMFDNASEVSRIFETIEESELNNTVYCTYGASTCAQGADWTNGTCSYVGCNNTAMELDDIINVSDKEVTLLDIAVNGSIEMKVEDDTEYIRPGQTERIRGVRIRNIYTESTWAVIGLDCDYDFP